MSQDASSQRTREEKRDGLPADLESSLDVDTFKISKAERKKTEKKEKKSCYSTVYVVDLK